MVSRKKPVSLPFGWTEQVKVTNGRKIKYYTNPDTGQKFYSKKQVIRYVNTGKVRSSALQSRNNHNNRRSQNKPVPIAVKTTESPGWLPHGWLMEVKTQKSGSQHKCYIDPATGRKFYSKPAVSRYVETLKCNSGTDKEGNIDNGAISNNVVKRLETNKSPEVKTSGSSVSLPHGWIMEVKTRKNGLKYKRYIDPASGCKLSSKREVSRYIESLNCNSGTEKEETIDNGAISNIALKTSESPEWLPNGWIMELKTRKSGSKFKCYIDPATGYEFHSKTAVSRYIETVKYNGDIAKEKEIDNGPISNIETTNQSPKWLPYGWIMEVKTKKYGFQYKRYTDPETGRKFYSKPEVSRYIESVKRNIGTTKEKKMDIGSISNGGIAPSTEGKSSVKPDDVFQNCETVVVETISPEGLPPGWIKEIRARKVASGIRKDPYYVDPVSGYEFRSKLDALRYLETGDVARCAIKPKKRGINDTVMKNEIGPSVPCLSDMGHSTGGKSSLKPNVSQDCDSVRSKSCTSKQNKMGTSKHSMNEVVVETSYPEGLPPGWIKEIRTRKLGNRIRKDPYYVDPVSEYEFRSKLDALRYLETGDVANCAIKPKKRGINDKSPSTVDGKKSRNSTKRRLFEGKQSRGTRNLKALEAESSKEKQGNSVCADVMVISAPPPEILGEKHSLDVSQEEKLPETLMEKHREKAQIGSSRSKKKSEVNLVGRSSKRLAGLKPETPGNLESSKLGLRAGTRKSTETEVNPSSSLGLDIAGHGATQPESEPEAEIVDHASKGKAALLDIEASNKIEKPVEDQHVSKEQQVILKTDTQDGGKAESQDAQLLYLFDDSAPDPCLDFEYKTLSGTMPVEDNLAVKDYFQQQPDTSHTQRDGLGLPQFGLPNFFHNDPAPHFDSQEKHAFAQPFSSNPTFLPRGNVNLPSWAIGHVDLHSWPLGNVNLPGGPPENNNPPGWPPGYGHLPGGPPGNVSLPSSTGHGPQQPSLDAGTRNIWQR